MPTGSHVATIFQGGSEFYRIPANPGDLVRLTIATSIAPPAGRIPELVFVDPVTGAALQGVFANGVSEIVNLTGQSQLGLLAYWGGDTPVCNEYTLVVEVTPTACSGLAPDALEENDSGDQALTLAPGDFTGPNLNYSDRDDCRVDVPPGTATWVEAPYLAPGVKSGLLMQVWSDCGRTHENYTVNSSPGRDTSLIENDTQVMHSVIIALSVDGQQFIAEAPCVEYDLRLRSYPSSFGVESCSSLPNSTGTMGKLQIFGGPFVVSGALTLRATQVAFWQSGIFFYGPNQVQVPFGAGVRCVGGALTRGTTVRFTGFAGEVFHTFDLSSQPYLGHFVPGTTWNTHFWHRDSGETFNVTDAVSFTWQ